MQTELLLTAAVGPNPAPIAEAIWALTRAPDSRIAEVHLAALARGHHYLHAELVGEGRALDDLRQQCLPGQCPPHAGVFEHLPRTAAGDIVDTDDDEANASLYRTAVWNCARVAKSRARGRPVVFLLAGGRRRTMTAYSATVYQLLAGPNDRLYDVRVSDRRAEGGSGFFFPTQTDRYIDTAAGLLDASTVDVSLVPVPLPQLGPLLCPEQLETFDTALAASQRILQGMVPPAVVVDLDRGEISINGRALPLSAAQAAWYAALCVQRTREPDGTGRGLPSDAGPLLPALLPGVPQRPWATENIRDHWMRQALGLPPHSPKPPTEPDEPGEKLKKLRADTRKAVTRWVAHEGCPGWETWLVPELHSADGLHWQRLRIPAASLTIIPVGGAA